MMSTSQTPYELIRISSTMSLPRQSISSYNIGQLAKFKSILEDAVVQESVSPLLNPYNLYRKRNSLPTGITSLLQLLKLKTSIAKKYIQASALNHCDVKYFITEQYITLNIMPEMIADWKLAGYTHLHLGVVRMILSY
jgi:hypothetical protein